MTKRAQKNGKLDWNHNNSVFFRVVAVLHRPIESENEEGQVGEQKTL